MMSMSAGFSFPFTTEPNTMISSTSFCFSAIFLRFLRNIISFKIIFNHLFYSAAGFFIYDFRVGVPVGREFHIQFLKKIRKVFFQFSKSLGVILRRFPYFFEKEKVM